MPPPDRFIEHLRESGYHPRSNKHSNELAIAIVHDLLLACPIMARRASEGRVVYDLNMKLHAGTATWNVDLVFGVPAGTVVPESMGIGRARPAAVRIAVEIKGIRTEHRKAVMNRKRDLEAHHQHVHNYDARAVAAGVFVINGAPTFRSPLRPGLTTHGGVSGVLRLIEHCVNEMRNVTESRGRSIYGLDAKAVLVVDFDNTGSGQADYITHSPAPQLGDPLHYDSFIRKLCDEYTSRFPSDS